MPEAQSQRSKSWFKNKARGQRRSDVKLKSSLEVKSEVRSCRSKE